MGVVKEGFQKDVSQGYPGVNSGGKVTKPKAEAQDVAAGHCGRGTVRFAGETSPGRVFRKTVSFLLMYLWR